MAPEAGSLTLFLLALVGICVLTLLLLRHYLPLRSTPAFLLIPIFLALALPCSIILLVPIDLATNSVIEEDGITRGVALPERFMTAMWRITYWLTFVLTWFVLPFMGEYVDSGHRDTKERVIYSFRSNLRYQLTILASGIAVLVYYILNHGFHASTIKGTVIALAYAWGLILAIYLMGHGLVFIPRRMFRNASTSGRLRRLQSEAPSIHSKMQEAIDDYDMLEVQVRELERRKTGTALDFQDWIGELVLLSNLPDTRASRAPIARVTEANVPHVITQRYLAELTRKLMRARHKRIRFVEEWANLVKGAKDLQKILDASSSRRLEFDSVSEASLFKRWTILTPYTRYHFFTYVIPAIRVTGSILLGCASICIVWSEVFKRAVPSVAVVGVSVIHHPKAVEKGKIGFAGQLIAGAWLCYMCAAALMSIREVKVWGNRALVRRNTYPESACWYAMQVAKLTVPLSYNFITFLPKEIYEQTTFHRFLGSLINFTPLGSAFSAFFPIFILFPVFASIFNLYGRIKRIFGFGFLDNDDEENTSSFGVGGWREGRALIEREQLNSTGLSLTDRRLPPGDALSGNSAPYSDDPREDSRGISSSNPASPLPQGTAPKYSRPTPTPSQRPTPQTRDGHVDDTEEEGNFFQDLAHRVRNTFDTTQKPDFKFNFTKPRWLTNDDDEQGASSSGPGPLDRLFGNRGGRGLRL